MKNLVLRTLLLLFLICLTANVFATVNDYNFGTGKDGNVFFSTTTKGYGNLTTPADYNVSGNTLILKADRIYDFNYFYLGTNTMLKTSDTNGVVLFIKATYDINILGNIDLNNINIYDGSGKTVALDGESFIRPSVSSGGTGGTGSTVRGYWAAGPLDNNAYGGTGSTATLGFGGGGGGGGGIVYGSTKVTNGNNATTCQGASEAKVENSHSGESAGSAGTCYDGNATGGTPGSGANIAMGGSGGGGGRGGSPSYILVLKSSNLNFTGKINLNGGKGNTGGYGVNGVSYCASSSYPSASGAGAGGGGGGGATGGKVYLAYKSIDVNSGTINVSKGLGGSAGDVLTTGYSTNCQMTTTNYWAGTAPQAGTNGLDGNIYFTLIKGVDSNFNYTIRKDLNKIILIDTSTEVNVTKTAWEWKSNGSVVGTTQDYNLTATQLTDYNICLKVEADSGAYTSTICKNISTGDWSTPITTFSSYQVANTSDQNIILTCTDNNSGCYSFSYRLNSGTWITKLYSDSNRTFLVSGAGDHNIQYYSTDNSDNNETTKTSSFTTYGKIRFNLYDENAGTALTGVTINDGTTDYSTGATNYYDFNLQGTTSGEKTYTISKTGYATRYYSTDLNEFSDLNISFALISNTIDSDVPFKVYQTDQSTLFTNTFVEVKDKDTNYTIGRLKTDSIGEVTFNLKADDSNYWTIVNNGQFTYSPVTVTIKYPKNEETLAQITEKWKIEITQNLYASYSDLNADKIVYLLPNTSLPYNIRISDMNGNYFSRTYAKTYPGNPLTDTLQPYLVSDTTGLLTIINTREATTNQPLQNVTFKIYKYISGLGRTLVEQINTDSKGQALALLVLNGEYEFESYYDSVLIKTFNITATSSTIYFILDLGATTIPPTTQNVFVATWNPKPNLLKAYTGTQTFTQTLTNINSRSITIISMVQQNGINLDANQTYTGSSSTTFTHTINWNTIGTLPVTSKMIVTTSDGNVYTFTQTYLVNIADGNTFGSTYSPLVGLTTGLREDFSCEYNTPLYYLSPCYPLFIIAVIICIALALWASVALGQFGGQSAGIIFLIGMILFTFLTWIPVYLTVGLVLIILAFIVNDRGGQ